MRTSSSSKFLSKPIKDHQLIQCTKNVIIHSPTPNCFHRLFNSSVLISDSEFFENVSEYMAKESTYRIILQPEPTACKGGFSGEMVNRFLPKDFFRDFLIRKVKQLAV